MSADRTAEGRPSLRCLPGCGCRGGQPGALSGMERSPGPVEGAVGAPVGRGRVGAGAKERAQGRGWAARGAHFPRPR
ncbi:hypothetical protein HPG69_016489 [Diceros bicornis minor]|uniref:Uncharacterized protein n=1 Tax=Diceros bicornis minor TaxID=77932 RepID=A0A7J7F5J4_DICBM|nr:hypothetical protein HPG69_016489 [Diceros bicornis minor]